MSQENEKALRRLVENIYGRPEAFPNETIKSNDIKIRIPDSAIEETADAFADILIAAARRKIKNNPKSAKK